jgi:hypothetical protein
MKIAEAKKISIVEFLMGLNIKPANIRGKDYWYFAIYRKDTNPSLSVNTERNLWYDNGTGAGGDLLELVKLLYSCDVSQALANIERIKPVPINFSFDCASSQRIQIINVKPLANVALVDYVKSRGINPQLAAHYVQEVHYSSNGRNYFAVGFKNDSGGFELRNLLWKGSNAPKNITSIRNSYDKCILFEGFFDFLTFLQHLKKQPTDYLILNGAVMIKRALIRLPLYKDIFYFGDNDQTGDMVLNSMNDAGINVRDCRYLYSGFKDLNEKYSDYK